MSRARKKQLAEARAGIQSWRVTLTRIIKPDCPAEINIQCGGRSVAETVQLLKNAVVLLERQLAAKPATGPIVGGELPLVSAEDREIERLRQRMTDANHHQKTEPALDLKGIGLGHVNPAG